MLSQEQCSQLADGGLPQELKSGDLYYWRPGLELAKDYRVQPTDWCIFRSPSTNPYFAAGEYYKIPDLAELMEFVVVACKEVFEDLFDRVELVAYDDTHQALLFTLGFHDDGARLYTDPHHEVAILAVYALWEKLMEVKA